MGDQDRRELEALLEEEGPVEAGYEEAWRAELKKRVDRALSDSFEGKPWEQVRKEALARLEARKRRSA